MSVRLRYQAVGPNTKLYSEKKDGEIAETPGVTLTGIYITIDGHESEIESEQFIGRDWIKKTNGELEPSTRWNYPIFMIKINLKGNMASEYDIFYRTFINGIGWTDWGKNGESSGNIDLGIPLEKFQAYLKKKGETPLEQAEEKMKGYSCIDITHPVIAGPPKEDALKVEYACKGCAGKVNATEYIYRTGGFCEHCGNAHTIRIWPWCDCHGRYCHDSDCSEDKPQWCCDCGGTRKLDRAKKRCQVPGCKSPATLKMKKEIKKKINPNKTLDKALIAGKEFMINTIGDKDSIWTMDKEALTLSNIKKCKQKRFKFEEAAEGSFYIIVCENGKYLTAKSSENGSEIIYEDKKENCISQMFDIYEDPLGNKSGEPYLGPYVFECKACLTQPRAVDRKEGEKLNLFSTMGGDTQRWEMLDY